MESMFRKTLKDMEELGLLDLFEKRCLVIQQKTHESSRNFTPPLYSLGALGVLGGKKAFGRDVTS